MLVVVWLENEEVENLLSGGDAIAHILFFPLLNGVGCSLAPFHLGGNSAKQGVKNVTVLNADRGLLICM